LATLVIGSCGGSEEKLESVSLCLLHVVWLIPGWARLFYLRLRRRIWVSKCWPAVTASLTSFFWRIRSISCKDALARSVSWA
jgi:hypothetical protein